MEGKEKMPRFSRKVAVVFIAAVTVLAVIAINAIRSSKINQQLDEDIVEDN